MCYLRLNWISPQITWPLNWTECRNVATRMFADCEIGGGFIEWSDPRLPLWKAPSCDGMFVFGENLRNAEGGWRWGERERDGGIQRESFTLFTPPPHSSRGIWRWLIKLGGVGGGSRGEKVNWAAKSVPLTKHPKYKEKGIDRLTTTDSSTTKVGKK